MTNTECFLLAMVILTVPSAFQVYFLWKLYQLRNKRRQP